MAIDRGGVWPNNSSPRWWAGLIVGAALAASVGGLLTGQRAPIWRDGGRYYFPLLTATSGELFGRGSGWNDREALGRPWRADPTAALDYPPRAIFWLPVDPARAYAWYVGGHVLLAAAAAWLAARRWRASVTGAAVAALSYALGGAVLSQTCNVVYLVGAAWLPLAWLAADRLVARRSWRAAGGLGVVLALMILGGDPQMAYHAVLATLLLCWLRRRRGRQATVTGRAAGAARAAGAGGLMWQRLILVAAACLAAALLAAPQLDASRRATLASQRAAAGDPRSLWEWALPSAALEPPAAARNAEQVAARSAVRGLFGRPAPHTHHEHAYYFSIGPWRWVELAWPNVAGRALPEHRRWLNVLPAEGAWWSPSLYQGLAPLVCALAAFRLGRGGVRRRWLSWLLVAGVAGSLGWYGLAWLGYEAAGLLGVDAADAAVGPQVGGLYWLLSVALPGYVYFRYPAKLWTFAALALALLAARGWDAAWRRAPRRCPWGVQWLAAGSAVAAVAIYLGGDAVLTRLAIPPDPTLGPFDPRGAQHDLLAAAVQTAIVAGLLAVAWRRAAESTWRPRAALLLLAVTAGELALANAWLSPTGPVAWFRPPDVPPHVRTDVTPAAAGAAPRWVYRHGPPLWRPPQFAERRSPDRLQELFELDRDTLAGRWSLAADLPLANAGGPIDAGVAAFRRPPTDAELAALGVAWRLAPAREEPASTIRPAWRPVADAALAGDRRQESTRLSSLAERVSALAWLAVLVAWLAAAGRSGGRGRTSSRR